jgi:hypothetical protein
MFGWFKSSKPKKSRDLTVPERLSEVLIYINVDGSARELTDDEKTYVDMHHHLADGNRPYIKSSFDARNGWDRISGFLRRKYLPDGMPVNPAPIIPRALDGT